MYNYGKGFIILGYFDNVYGMWWNEDTINDFYCFEKCNRISKHNFFDIRVESILTCANHFKEVFDV